MTSLLYPWNFQGKNTGVACHFLLQGIFPTQGLNSCLLCLLHCRQSICLLSHLANAPSKKMTFIFQCDSLLQNIFSSHIFSHCLTYFQERNTKIYTSPYHFKRASLVAQVVMNLPAMQETRVQSLGQEDPLEKGMATHASILDWEIPCTEKPGWLQSTGLQRIGHN